METKKAFQILGIVFFIFLSVGFMWYLNGGPQKPPAQKVFSNKSPFVNIPSSFNENAREENCANLIASQTTQCRP
ncbi:MAG: hypothetical protein Q7R75_00060 [bacterium]|nr:hypothetical protein [bacterium]